ncbi:W [Drosophila busckii]|uniref:W n=1 Tax=Drosophila busckii TaxID=30019 RepID=A0A0M3QX02_DROBS|nr:W [Drosophila busckii] [Drosophila busckii]
MAQSPGYASGDVFFAHMPGHMPLPPPPPRTPRTSVSFAAGDEHNFFRHSYPAPSTPQPMPAPQSAPPLHYSHSYPQQSPHMMPHHHSFGLPPPASAYYANYTPPPTPNTANASTSSSSSSSAAATGGGVPFGWHMYGHNLASTPLAPAAPKMRLQRSQSDAARRNRKASPGPL